ncbi:MAG: DUF448 domain-containing protein [Mycoplasmataceae bacterium]|nr:DUF448 domain-containing protein [Mycoplasmataceae bacterium]
MRSLINNRKDIITSKTYSRNLLIRISVFKNGVTRIDKEYNLGGRGIYVLPTSIKKGLENNFIKKNIKKFKGNIDDIKKELLKEAK